MISIHDVLTDSATQQRSNGIFLFPFLAVVFMSFLTNYSLRAEIPIPEINHGENV